MAEEKLGTLQYDMLVSETKLKESLDKIDLLLKKKEQVSGIPLWMDLIR